MIGVLFFANNTSILNQIKFLDYKYANKKSLVKNQRADLVQGIWINKMCDGYKAEMSAIERSVNSAISANGVFFAFILRAMAMAFDCSPSALPCARPLASPSA